MQRVLITGASGYLGRRLFERWGASSGVALHGTYQAHEERLVHRGLPNVHYHRCDITDAALVAQLFAAERFDTVIHGAALLPDGAPDYVSRAVRTNVFGAALLAERAAAAGVRRFVYCSSISVYGDAPRPETGWTEEAPAAPASPYGWSKLAGEQCVVLACAGSPMTAVILRLAGIHGGGRRGGALYHFASGALAGRPLTVHHPTAPFQVLFLDDAVEAVWRAAAADVRGPAALRLNVASHVFPSMRLLAQSIVEMTASTSAVAEGAQADVRGDVMDSSRMRGVLGYRPPPGEQRLREYCAMLRTAAL